MPGEEEAMTDRRMVMAALGVWALLVPHPVEAGDPVRINGSGTSLDFMKVLLREYAAAHPGGRVEVDAPMGSTGSILALLGGALDLAVAGRPLSPEEEARGARALPYGRTPLLIVTHGEVEKRDVTTFELEEIYSGRLAAWPDGESIRVILRPERESNTAILASLSPEVGRAQAAARKHPWALVAVTDPESNKMVARTPGAIGAASLTSLLVEELPLNRLTLNGVAGTTAALAAGTYPLAKPILFVTTERTPPAAWAIVDFACSSRGRAVAEKAGVLAPDCGPRRPTPQTR